MAIGDEPVLLYKCNIIMAFEIIELYDGLFFVRWWTFGGFGLVNAAVRPGSGLQRLEFCSPP